MLGNIPVKFAITYGISICISAPHGGSGLNKYILKPPDIPVAHLRHGELDRKTFKSLE